MIRFSHLSKTFGTQTVLNDVSFEIRAGEIFSIVGPSGTGKSVTLKHIVRLLQPTSGEVWVDGVCVSDIPERELPAVRSHIGYLFQSAALLAWLNVYDNVALPLIESPVRIPPDDIRDRVMDALAKVGLENHAEKFPSDLSGGMQKRAGLARAIVTRPKILLYDEPTSGLDPVTSRRIDALITELKDRLGVTSVVVTHDMHSALAISDRIAMLGSGRVITVATPAEFLTSPEPAVQDFLAAQYITHRGPWETATIECSM